MDPNDQNTLCEESILDFYGVNLPNELVAQHGSGREAKITVPRISYRRASGRES